MGLVLIVLLILLVFGGAPGWGYHSYGWYPSGGLFLILILVVIVVLVGGRF